MNDPVPPSLPEPVSSPDEVQPPRSSGAAPSAAATAPAAPLGRASELQAWLALARLSNLPTILTNVLVGVASAAAHPEYEADHFPWRPVLPLFLAISLLYIGGMILNDVADARLDERERPHRPIPSGRIARAHALAVALACLAIGVVLLLLSRTPPLLALALPAAIIAYDLTHARFAASALLMGVCRGLTYLIAGATLVTIAEGERISGGLWLLAALLALYITTVTLISQRETSIPDAVRRLLSLVPPLLLFPALLLDRNTDRTLVILTAAAALVWLSLPAGLVLRDVPRTRSAVLVLLAGICLVDLFFLAVLGAPGAALAVAAGCFVLTVLLHRRIAGT